MHTHHKLQYPIHEIFAKRWSPKGFDPLKPIAQEDIHSLFEAARWTPSSYNEQPWRYAYATRKQGKAFNDLVECLNPANQVWATNAYMLVVGMSSTNLHKTGKPNGKFQYDLGGATISMVYQAMSKGIYAHQMGGFQPDKVYDLHIVPEGCEPIVFIAFGYITPEEALKEPEDVFNYGKHKYRKEQEEFVRRYEG
jgi:nitroreductase